MFVRRFFSLVRGLYSAASGALAAQSMVDNVANNLANVNTNGFKQTLVQFQTAPTLDIYRIQLDPGHAAGSRTNGVPVAPYVGALGTGVQIYDTPNKFDEGSIQTTGNPTDVAIAGAPNAMFAVQTANGIRYTRDGQFVINAQNTLVTTDGNPVMGRANAPIVVRDGSPVKISPDGTVTQNGQTIDSLAVVNFGNMTALRPQGDNLFVDTGAANPQFTQATVLQGSLEKSNANVVKEMVDLINAERWFDASQKTIQTQDNATNEAIAELGNSKGR